MRSLQLASTPALAMARHPGGTCKLRFGSGKRARERRVVLFACGRRQLSRGRNIIDRSRYCLLAWSVASQNHNNSLAVQLSPMWNSGKCKWSCTAPVTDKAASATVWLGFRQNRFPDSFFGCDFFQGREGGERESRGVIARSLLQTRRCH